MTRTTSLRPRAAAAARLPADELNERLERLGRNRTATAAHRMRENEPENGRVLELIETAVQAIERLERRNAEPAPASAPMREPNDLNRIVDELERRLATPQRTPSGRPQAFIRPGRTDDPEFHRAVSEIDERRRMLDEASSPRSNGRAGGAGIEAMRQQLDTLLERIEEMRGQAGRETVPLQERIDQIAGRIESWQSRPNEDTALIRGISRALPQPWKRCRPSAWLAWSRTRSRMWRRNPSASTATRCRSGSSRRSSRCSRKSATSSANSHPRARRIGSARR